MVLSEQTIKRYMALHISWSAIFILILGKFTMYNGMKRLEYGYVCSTEQEIIEKLTREEKRMQAIIYTKPHCQKCRLTVSKLSQVMPVQTITADDDDYERFRKLGYRSMPVVTVYKAYGVHDRWCDLRIDKIKQYTEAEHGSKRMADR